MAEVKSINHVAVVVSNMEASLRFWREALGMELRELRDVPAEEAQVAFLPTSGSEVELVLPTAEPVDNNDQFKVGDVLEIGRSNMAAAVIQVKRNDEDSLTFLAVPLATKRVMHCVVRWRFAARSRA